LIYRFDRYELDDELFELRVDGQIFPLARKSFDLLRYLVMHADRVVTKEELFEAIWSGEHVTESVLPVNVRTIRKALGDERSERVLKTVRGRGYRVVCRVECIEQRISGGPVHPSRSRFVGREGLLEELFADYRSALSGEGRVVLLYGEAGIGKSRLMDEFGRRCGEERAIVNHAVCPDDAGAPPFWPVLRMLQDGFEQLSAEEYRADLERIDFDLERARASIAEYLQEGHVTRMDPEAARFRLTQLVLRLLEQSSQVAPLVLLLDDAHFMDEGTSRLCEQVVREVPRNRVVAIISYRDSDLRRGSNLARFLGFVSGQDGLRQLRMRGFDPAEVRDFIRLEGEVEAPDVWVDSLWQRTEGNPLFLRETLRLLVSSGRIKPGASTLPSVHIGLAQGIRETIGRRLDLLSDTCNQVLRWASVVGRRFSIPVLDQVGGPTGPKLLELLAEAENAHVISSSPGSDHAPRLPLGEFEFSHALIWETIYSDLSGPERVLRHRAVAEAIERLYGAASGERIFELAKHFFEAAPGGDVDRAVDYSLRAARYAQLRYANDDAVRHYENALRAEELRVPRDDLRFCSIVLGHADALWRAAHYELSEQSFLRAVELARVLGRFDLMGYAVLGMVGWPRLSHIAVGGAGGPVSLQRARDLAREALTGLAHSAPSLSAQLTAVLVRVGGKSLDEDRNELADRALELARESGDDRALFYVLLAKQSVVPVPEKVYDALELASEAVRLAQQLRGRTRILSAYEARIPLLLMIGDMALADADIAAAIRISEKMGSPAHLYAARRFELARALADGRLSRSSELVRDFMELGKRVGDDGADWASQLVSFWMLAAGNRAPVVKRAFESFAPELIGDADGPAIAAYFYTLAGERNAARQHFDRVAQIGFARLRQNPFWLWQYCSLADVAVFLGDRERAAELYELILPFKHINVLNKLYAYRGAAAGPLAGLAHLLGRRDEAVALAEMAIAFNQRIGARHSVVWVRCVLASILCTGASVERRRGEALFKDVEREAEETGLKHLVESYRASLRRAG